MTESNWVAGIDPSLSGFAVVCMNGDKEFVDRRWTSHFLGSRVDARMDRMLPLIESVMEVLDKYRPRVVCIEGYSHMSQGRGINERIELGGVLRADLHTADYCDIYEVAPMCLKKFCTGTGKGDKTAMIAVMTKRWGVEFFDSDRYDAYGLARMALCISGLAKPGTVPQRQAIETVLRGPKSKTRTRS